MTLVVIVLAVAALKSAILCWALVVGNRRVTIGEQHTPLITATVRRDPRVVGRF